MTALFKSPKMPSPPPVPEPPTQIDMEKSAALAEESLKQVKKKKGRPSTIIGGGLASDTSSTSAKPTLMG